MFGNTAGMSGIGAWQGQPNNNCQNLNPTTTQPNLNQVVGLDMIIAFHIYAVEPPILQISQV